MGLTTYKVCKAIANNEDYNIYYNNEYQKAYNLFKNKIDSYEYGRCRLGVVSLIAVLNPNQNQIKEKQINDFFKNNN